MESNRARNCGEQAWDKASRTLTEIRLRGGWSDKEQSLGWAAAAAVTGNTAVVPVVVKLWAVLCPREVHRVCSDLRTSIGHEN